VGWVFFDFFAELVDYDAEIFGFVAVFGTPDGLQETTVGDGFALLSDEMLEDFEFLGREMDFGTGHGDAALFKIHGQFFGLEGRNGVGGGVPAERGANAGEEFFDAEGLGDVIIGAGVEGDDFVTFGVANGEDDDGNVAPGADFAAGFDARDAGKINVEKNEVGTGFGDEVDGFFAAGSFGDGVAAEGKSAAQDATNLRFVVDDEDISGGGSHREASLAGAATGTAGRVKEKTEPWASWLVTEMAPPWAATMARAMGRPMPVPRTW